jgi:hypothetical protein
LEVDLDDIAGADAVVDGVVIAEIVGECRQGLTLGMK